MKGFGDRLRAALASTYRIKRELGRGGMATVFLAEDLKHGRSVAVKVLHPEVAVSLGAERFVREIQVASRLQHPHIVPLYDSGEADGLLYYVMPYVEGETLRARLAREKQLPLDDALHIVREVAGALSYAHTHGFIHRDIKPENILLSGGHAVVADFGIARAVSVAGGEGLTETGHAVGTPAYMSPEQAAGDSELDCRSDIYSLACVLYETLTGGPPFTGPSSRVVLAKHLLDPVPTVRTARPTVSDAFERTIQKALAKTPADRFPTVAGFAEALAAAGEGEIVEREDRALSAPLSLWQELGRRHVYHVAAVYAAAAWLITEVAGILIPYLNLPDQAVTLTIALAILGFPIALALAWAFEFTRDGVRRTQPLAQKALISAGQPRRRLTGGSIATGVLILTLLAAAEIVPRLLAPLAAHTQVSAAMGSSTAAAVERGSIAVLPFASIGEDPENQYFSHGITEDIIAKLSGIADLKVTARASSMQYANTDKSPREIGAELGVSAVLEGSVRKVGAQVHVTAQLVDCGSNRNLWADVYDREVTLQNIFAVQSDIAANIVAALHAEHAPAGRGSVASPGTESLTAWSKHQEGRFYLDKWREADILRSIVLFREALAADSTFALAYTGLARAYLLLGIGHGSMDPREAFPLVREAAMRALEIDPDLAEAHGALGIYFMHHAWEWDEAERAFRRAITLDPNAVTPRSEFAHLLYLRGRHEEAIAIAGRAVELDPISGTAWGELGLQYYMAERYPEAIHFIKRGLEFSPDLHALHWILGACYAEVAERDLAIQHLDRSAELSGRKPFFYGFAGYGHALVGDTAAARRVLAELEASWAGSRSPGNLAASIAYVYIGLGEHDSAFRWLDTAYELRSSLLSSALVSPLGRRLSSDPRYEALLRKMELEL
jgi:TolB-like protein/Flp pilus assembly protein TadD